MAGNTNSIGLTINSSNPLNTTNGGIGRSATPTAGSVLFYDATGVQQNNGNLFWNNSSNSLCVGTTTSNGPLTAQGTGGTTGSTMLIGSFNTNGTPAAGNLIGIQVNKSGTDALLMGVNKNTATGGVPANALFISNFLTNGQISIGRGAGNGLPNSADLQIDGSGNVLVNNGNLNVANVASSSLVVTSSLGNFTGTNTLSSTVLGNITKVTVTKLTSGSGTYTPPANCTHIRVRMWGAGGGGGGVAGNAASGGAAGGGASGGYIESIITSPTAVSYSVGTAGAGGVAGNNSGTAGGNTTFSTFTAAGGGGGGGYNSGLGSGNVLGGQGGSNVGSPTISYIGNAGSPGNSISATVVISGAGAVPPMGGGAPSGVRTSLAGLPANSIGAGGGGAASTNGTSFAGGSGGSGQIIVEEYYNG